MDGPTTGSQFFHKSMISDRYKRDGNRDIKGKSVITLFFYLVGIFFIVRELLSRFQKQGRPLYLCGLERGGGSFCQELFHFTVLTLFLSVQSRSYFKLHTGVVTAVP